MPLSSQRRIENECSWRAAEHLGIVESAFAQSAETQLAATGRYVTRRLRVSQAKPLAQRITLPRAIRRPCLHPSDLLPFSKDLFPIHFRIALSLNTCRPKQF